ncbi:S1C family serine protease [Streptomyces sp. NPDC017230]|uniref:S1C family serine protease n=1 Tax=unclassified Streptomyces TaxID=2593676 RepID=UPI003792371A
MNEGKPTKAKWWSRPRSPEDTTDGDFELERPRTATDVVADGDDGGDFELERPAAVRVADEGDYELDRPASETDRPTDGGGTAYPGEPAGGAADAVPYAGAGTGAGPYADAAPDTGVGTDAGLQAGVGTNAGFQGGVGADPGPHAGTGIEAGPDTGVGIDAGPDAGVGIDAGPDAGVGADRHGTDADAVLTTAPVAERGKPLHDPDPYSTPPYGEPGPWAPAPPVQHPTATPAHGTVAPGAPSAPSAPVVPVVPEVPVVPSQAPPPGAVPDPALADAPPPAPPAHATTAAAAPPGPPITPITPMTPAAPASQASASPDPGSAGPGADPWGRYDPWAAAAHAAPLQHSGAVAPTPVRRRRRARTAAIGGAVLIALVSGGVGGAMGTYLERNGGVGTVELPQAGKEAAERAPDSVAGIAARALPSVVTLHVSGGDAAGTGTGFVLDDRGHILTNNHVVEPAGSGGEITVTFNSGDTAEATLVGRDSGYDLAVVKVKGVSGLTPLPLGNSENVLVGDPVVAIGAPFDLAGTVTSGIISAKERPITAGGEEGDGSDVSYVDALQTDAPINPGNSGGPLLDAQGRAIGINSAIRSAGSGGTESDGGQAGSIGLGFAIPINQGKRVAEELINTGKATHPVIGITLDMNYAGDGARVGAEGSDGGPAVTTGGPGAEAGIKPGDVITAVDGQRVHSGEELIVKTRAHRPGDRLELTLERDGKETTVSLVLGSSDGG